MSAVLQDPQLMEVNPPLVRSEDYHDLTEQISVIVEGDVVKTPHEVLDHAGDHGVRHRTARR